MIVLEHLGRRRQHLVEPAVPCADMTEDELGCEVEARPSQEEGEGSMALRMAENA